jgi:hypothetical protein
MKMRLLVVTVVWLLLAASGAGTVSAGEAAAKPAAFAGTVVETMNAASYTYVMVDTGKEKVWAAAPQFVVKVGDKVSFKEGMAMQKYESKTLKRTFDTIYFVGRIQVAGQIADQGEANPHGNPHAGMAGKAKRVPVEVPDFSGIKKPAGGLTVTEVFTQKTTVANKQVTVRGKVVKFNKQIMGKNWLHVQDGTGDVDSHDLTITTADEAQVGDTVLVSGTVVLDKDFGAGYKYPLMLEEAKVTVEHKVKP